VRRLDQPVGWMARRAQAREEGENGGRQPSRPPDRRPGERRHRGDRQARRPRPRWRRQTSDHHLHRIRPGIQRRPTRADGPGRRRQLLVCRIRRPDGRHLRGRDRRPCRTGRAECRDRSPPHPSERRWREPPPVIPGAADTGRRLAHRATRSLRHIPQGARSPLPRRGWSSRPSCDSRLPGHARRR